MKVLLLLLSVALVPACSGAEQAPAQPALSPEEALRQMQADIQALQARPEHTDAQVTIQHLLVGVKDAGTAAAHTPAEAERLAAELYARAKAGEDFDLLVKNHTADSHPGIYTMSLGPSPSPSIWPRADMVAGFGDVAWRLAVGQLGVAPFDGGSPEPKSPFGYHIVKRLK